mgnify:CR=1 FL=1
MSNKRIDLTQMIDLASRMAAIRDEYGLASVGSEHIEAHEAILKLTDELKRCYEVMNEVILRAMDAREEEVSDIIKHGDEEYVHVDEITYPFSKSDIDAAFDSKASE